MASTQALETDFLLAARQAAIPLRLRCIFAQNFSTSFRHAFTESIKSSTAACADNVTSFRSFAHRGLILLTFACIQCRMRPSPDVTVLQYAFISSLHDVSSF